jgi:hypothetical protein
MILDGRAEFHCGERGSRAGSGTSMLLPKGVPHWLQVTTDAPCRSLVLTSPAQFEGFVAEAGEPALTRELPPAGPPDVARAARAGERFRIETLGPPPTAPMH